MAGDLFGDRINGGPLCQPPSVQANLARGLLWLAFVWNDHNFEAAHKEARRIAERAGIRSLEDANAWLEAAPAGAGAKGEGE